MRLRYKILSVVMAAVFILNFSYIHAFAATLVTTNDCSETLFTEAQARISDVYDMPGSNPIRLCVDEPVLGLDVSYGMTRFAPGLPSIIIMGSKGTNVDVTSHEWVHAELAYQLSFLRRNFKTPVWLDEGIAMQVDWRDDYTLSSLHALLKDPDLAVPELKDLKKANEFFQSGQQGKLHYALANCIVAELLSGYKNNAVVASETVELASFVNMISQKPTLTIQAYDACTSLNSR